MIDKIQSYIQERELCAPDAKIVAAVSGGIDSAVLCDVLAKLKMPFVIAHCNFGLREEADADELFVKKLAKKYEVPVFTEHFDTTGYAESEKISIQMAARHLRYNWFEKIRQQENADFIATGHHSDDTAETMLLNLTKGTGIAGLHGIPPKNGFIIRPLLSLTKDDIYEYVTVNRLIWREDSSNDSTKYQRNLIRHEVIPVLKQINPNFETTALQTAEKIAGVEQIFHTYLEQVRKHTFHPNPEGDAIFIGIPALRKTTAMPMVLFELLKPYNFNYVVVKEIIEAFDGISGKTFESATHTLVKDREQLVLTPKNLGPYGSYSIKEDQSELQHPDFTLQLQTKPAETYKIPITTKIAALDRGLLQFPLKVRKWKEGDWFIPLGMKGKKKISDFLIDKKVPSNLKSNVWVLTSDKSIVWVIGHRIDERFKFSDKTEQIFEVHLEK